MSGPYHSLSRRQWPWLSDWLLGAAFACGELEELVAGENLQEDQRALEAEDVVEAKRLAMQVDPPM